MKYFVIDFIPILISFVRYVSLSFVNITKVSRYRKLEILNSSVTLENQLSANKDFLLRDRLTDYYHAGNQEKRATPGIYFKLDG